MSKVVEELISSGEQWKYSVVGHGSGEDFHARVTYNDDGSINEKETYSTKYYKELHKQDGSKNKKKKEKSKKSNSKKESDSCLVKILKAPFRLLWWIIKFVLKICGIWFIISIFTGDDDN